MPRGKLIIITGPSGVGKGTLIDHVRDKIPRCELSVSATTRSPRSGEVSGKDYHFITRTEFERGIAAGQFLEHAEYDGNLYGTPRGLIERTLAQGSHLLLEIEVQGARQVMKQSSGVVSVFILPPKPRLESLRARLLKRGEDPQRIERRLPIAEREMREAKFFEYTLVNDDLGLAKSVLLSYLQQRLRAAA